MILWVVKTISSDPMESVSAVTVDHLVVSALSLLSKPYVVNIMD